MGNIVEQLKYREGYVDKKITVNTKDDLLNIATAERFKGLTVTVLNLYNNQSGDFWLINGTAKSNWRLKNIPSFNDKEDLDELKEVCTSTNTQTQEKHYLIDDGFMTTTKDGKTYKFTNGEWEELVISDDSLYWIDGDEEE